VFIFKPYRCDTNRRHFEFARSQVRDNRTLCPEILRHHIWCLAVSDGRHWSEISDFLSWSGQTCHMAELECLECLARIFRTYFESDGLES
jgi:hypothetical protein